MGGRDLEFSRASVVEMVEKPVRCQVNIDVSIWKKSKKGTVRMLDSTGHWVDSPSYEQTYAKFSQIPFQSVRAARHYIRTHHLDGMGDD